MKALIAIFSFLVFEAIFAGILYLIFSFVAWDMSWMINDDGFGRFVFVLLSLFLSIPSYAITDEIVSFIDDRFY